MITFGTDTRPTLAVQNAITRNGITFTPKRSTISPSIIRLSMCPFSFFITDAKFSNKHLPTPSAKFASIKQTTAS